MTKLETMDYVRSTVLDTLQKRSYAKVRLKRLGGPTRPPNHVCATNRTKPCEYEYSSLSGSESGARPLETTPMLRISCSLSEWTLG